MSESDGQSGSMSKLDLVTKHFAVLSTVITVSGVMISSIFFASYLAVFDRSLIWLIELSDLAKFGILLFHLRLSFVFNTEYHDCPLEYAPGESESRAE
jgi:hypothetical protein